LYVFTINIANLTQTQTDHTYTHSHSKGNDTEVTQI